MYLTGTFQHNLDAKSRLTLPASFRKQVGDTVCLVPLDDAIYGFTPESHKAWVSSFFPQGLNPRNRRDVQLHSLLMRRTVTVEVDSAGRIALGKVSAEALQKLGIEREVTVIGNDDHFEIWSAAAFKVMDEQIESLDDLMFDD